MFMSIGIHVHCKRLAIPLQQGGHVASHCLCRVYKQIKRFGNWVESHSPGSDFHFVASVYKIANCHPNLVHTRKSPQLVLRKGNYEVTLEQYGPPANPQTLQVMPLSPNLVSFHNNRFDMCCCLSTCQRRDPLPSHRNCICRTTKKVTITLVRWLQILWTCVTRCLLL